MKKLLSALVIVLLSTYACIAKLSNKSLLKTSVMITNLAHTSGGSGVILKSKASKSIILTNAHVCEIAEVVENYKHEQFFVTSIKKDTVHDLCIVEVMANLGVNVHLASTVEEGDDITIVGHPSLLPTIITKGVMSGRMVIPVQDGERPCTEEEKTTELSCILLGVMPRVIEREAQVVSATIMAGSSGSPVFNESGELVGLVFAGQQGLSYGFIVPLEYIKVFLKKN